MEYCTLSNGLSVPVLGYGCNTLGRSIDEWRMEPDGDYRPLYYALEAGYRYFDTAIDYHNEPAMGLFLSESSIPREELFISSKLPQRNKYICSKEATAGFIDRSLARFHTDHLDMFLIHRPCEDVEGLLRAWRVIERYYKEGKICAIGVSNFEIPLLKIFLAETDVKPMVNQVMINPGHWNREVVAFCKENDIRPTAWSPLRNLTEENRAELTEIGRAYGKSWAQVLLRFYLQSGISVVPKSHIREEVAQNIDIFDFSLTKAELAAIDQMRGVAFEFKL